VGVQREIIQSGAADAPILEVGDAIIVQATANISTKGSTAYQKKEILELIPRIMWAKKGAIITKESRRVGVVGSNHPASDRWEFGTARTYPATKFFSAAAMSVASRLTAQFVARHVESGVEAEEVSA
jgi:hypothetical protein